MRHPHRYPDPVSETSGRAPWTWRPADTLIAACLFFVAVGISLPVAAHFHLQAAGCDRERERSLAVTRSVDATIEHLEGRQADMALLRREANRYVAEVEARPIVPWTTLMTEVSTRRPAGVWLRRLSGSGPHFRAQVAALRPELPGAFALQLRESPYLEFAGLPADGLPGSSTRVVGKALGE
jgi:hypothetical protein